MTGLVLEVTDDKSLAKEARKQGQIDHAPHLTPDARLIKVADKAANLSDLVASPPGWPVERMHEYARWARRVLDALGPVNSGLEVVCKERIEMILAMR